MISTELLHLISSGIVVSGIKYIMFPLHLLHFCILKLVNKEIYMSLENLDLRDRKKENKEEKESRSEEDKHAKTDEASTSRSSGSQSETINVSSHGKDSEKIYESGNEGPVIIGEEDASSTPNNAMITNVNMDIDRSISFAASEEPKDISMEKCSYQKSQITVETLLQIHGQQSHIEEVQDSSLLDEEVANIFQKQCTSSEDDHSLLCSRTATHDKTSSYNSLRYEKTNKFATVTAKSKEEEVDKDLRKKKTFDDSIHYKRKKVSLEEDKPNKQEGGKGETKHRTQKCSFQQNSPSKSKTQSPVKSKESKRRDVKYKEMATQTDNSSFDDDVNIVPVDTKPKKRVCHKYAAYRSHPNLHQNKKVQQESNYVADNEDSSDGFAKIAKIARKRISAYSRSSSLKDLDFDEYGSTTPSDSDFGLERLYANARDMISNDRLRNRAPPGFPKLPQNPPLLSYTHIDWYQVTRSQKNNADNESKIAQLTPTIVQRAPTPMRHLYYNYPEFMDDPQTIKSSTILSYINQNYYL